MLTQELCVRLETNNEVSVNTYILSILQGKAGRITYRIARSTIVHLFEYIRDTLKSKSCEKEIHCSKNVGSISTALQIKLLSH